MSYISLEEFKKLPLGVSLKGMDDSALQSILDVATENVENLCMRVFSSAYYTESFQGNGQATKILWNYPVVNYISVKQTDISTGTETSLDTTKFVRTTDNDGAGLLVLSGQDTVTSFSPACVYEVEYYAGFSAIPPTVKHATALWATELLQPDFTGPNQQNVELIPATSEQITELLSRWKRRRISA